MRKLLVITALILSLCMVNALQISAPNELSENSVLFFSVELDDADDFDETEISLDNELMVTVYDNQFVVPNSISVLDAYVVDNNPSAPAGLNLYVALVGLDKGSHTLRAKALQDGSQSNTDSKEISVFTALGQDFEDQVTTELSEFESWKKQVTSELPDYYAQATAAQTAVENAQASIASLESMAQSQQSSISSLQAEVSNLTVQLNGLQADLVEERALNEELETEVNLLEEELESKVDNPLTGFVSVGGDVSPLLGLGVLVIVLVAGWFFIKNRRTGEDTLYTEFENKEETPFRADDDSSSFLPGNDKEESFITPDTEDKDILVPGKGGKWAFGKKSGSQAPQEKKRFDLGDLLKK